MWTVSVVVSTYNRADQLRLCIAALEAQSRPPDEVMIADDGSRPEHVRAIEAIVRSSPLRILHAWQEDLGFRLAGSRNGAVRRASGDYLFFLDGDAVLFPDSLEQHMKLSRADRWLTGDAVRLSPEETGRVTQEAILSRRLAELWPEPADPRVLKLRRFGRRFRFRMWRARLWPSERFRSRIWMWGLQMSMPRAVFERVNGFDEGFHGWGYEDKDLGLRLQLAGYPGRTVIGRSRAFHLWHEVVPRPRHNKDYFYRPRHGQFRCCRGLVQEPPPEEAQAP